MEFNDIRDFSEGGGCWGRQGARFKHGWIPEGGGGGAPRFNSYLDRYMLFVVCSKLIFMRVATSIT